MSSDGAPGAGLMAHDPRMVSVRQGRPEVTGSGKHHAAGHSRDLSGGAVAVVRRLRRLLARRGFRGTLSEGLRRLRYAISHERRLLLFRVPVADLRRVEPRLTEGMQFTTSVVTAEEGLLLAADQPTLTPVLRDHVAQVRIGEDLLVVRMNGRLAGWCIVACETRERWPLTETDSELELRSGDAVFTAGFVAPEFRGRRVFQAMYGAAADLATAKGARQLWSWCEVWNEPSRRAMLAVGFRYLGSQFRRTILGISGKLRVEWVEGPAGT